MSDAIWLAVIVGAFGTLSTLMPLLMARQAAKARADEKTADNKRQDEIAKRAEAVATKAEEAAAVLRANTDAAAAQARKTDAKLDGMHLLINSLYTAAKVAELRAVELALTTLRVLQQKGPTPELDEQVKAMEAECDRLHSELEERAAAAKFAAEKHEV